MSLFVYVLCVYVYVYVSVYVCVYGCVNVCVCMCVYLCVYVCVRERDRNVCKRNISVEKNEKGIELEKEMHLR